VLANDPIKTTKIKVDQAYEKLLKFLHIDPADRTIFFGGIPVSSRSTHSRHEDTAQNPWHTILLIWCLSGIGIHYNAGATRYRRCLLASVALFCLFLTWQPWITRLQAPLFALAAPLAGIALEKAEKLRKIFHVLLVLYCVPVLFQNTSRPLISVPPLVKTPFSVAPLSALRQSRDALYFCNKPGLRERYFAAVEVLVKEKADRIGLVIGGDSWEYPLWALMRRRVPVMPEIRHIVPPETVNGLPGDSSPVFAPRHLFVLERKLAWEKPDEIQDSPLRLFKLVAGAYERLFSSFAFS
jgi:hypothetical protein